MHEFELIEDSVLTALTPLKAEGVKALSAYAGQLEGEALELMDLAGRFPCVYVAAGGLTSETANKTDTIDTSVVVVIGDKNVRGGDKAARGDGQSPGVYLLLERVKTLLHRQRIIPGFLPLVRQREYPALYQPAQGVCVFMAVYATRCMK
ncbi:MAG: hypothetical protein A2Y38_12965 [Spirochaetes bacterium GWB1_59_5]|jgi:phage gp37-like protein|nr:MAG: hypothetical protein A2Y38_12965 [Spirochaetes bacterium GWB1_59_5]